MKIILEGPDNAGKTTLANKIKDRLGEEVEYKHPGGAPETLEDEHRCVAQQLEWLKLPRVIIDRITPISQMVYNFNMSLAKVREAYLQEYLTFKPLIIYCRPTTDRLLRTEELTWRYDETEDHKQKIITNQHKFVASYDIIMAKVPCIVYNYEEPESEMICDMIFRGMYEDPAALTWFNNLVKYTR